MKGGVSWKRKEGRKGRGRIKERKGRARETERERMNTKERDRKSER